ncbi:hypothetical protein B0H63DRAFT_106 [Podospora didyma]|uniref:Uncharacterized protein n=1 Tax=Podospora didyma TaxID=330526 RepID=A0AAE0U6S2_9PEZI|nr:hypothetical protein B0H63DRAFT_106 [Podospora didyma]
MSRLFRPLRLILGSSKISAKLPAGEGINLKRVRIKTSKRSSAKITFAAASLAFGLTLYIDRKLEEIEIPLEPGENEADQPALFLPLPLTTKKLEPQPYAGWSPEWKEFVRISRDKALQDRIRHGIAALVLKTTMASPGMTSRCGKDMKLRRYWMDLDFPYKAPPEYERSGILFTPDGAIGIARVPVESLQAKLLERVLWPRPFALSFWAFGTALAKEKVNEVAKYFGFETGDSGSGITRGSPMAGPAPMPTTHNAQVQKALQQIRQQATKRPEEVSDPSAMATAAEAAAAAAAAANAAPNASGRPGSSKSEKQPAEERFAGENWLRSFYEGNPWKEFVKTYRKTWKPLKDDPPRGCVAVSGLVEIETSKAYAVIDVFAWYNPKTNSYDERSMWMSLRRMQYKKQAPLS